MSKFRTELSDRELLNLVNLVLIQCLSGANPKISQMWKVLCYLRFWFLFSFYRLDFEFVGGISEIHFKLYVRRWISKRDKFRRSKTDFRLSELSFTGMDTSSSHWPMSSVLLYCPCVQIEHTTHQNAMDYDLDATHVNFKAEFVCQLEWLVDWLVFCLYPKIDCVVMVYGL